jgi:hypothetical protein
MTIPVFVGPTLSGQALPAGFRHRPPAQEGDVYRATLARPRAIGLIDGQFEVAPSVWHKEILWALTQGIHVFGAASLGALRAAELARFGMTGIGAICEDYRSGALTDDDEVTILHAPAELGYRPLTDAMVDIRATLAAARESGVLSARRAQRLDAIAKALFFKDRTWARVLQAGRDTGTLSAAAAAAFGHWLQANKVDRKGTDARAMLAAMQALLEREPKPFRPTFAFSDTVHWQLAIRTWSKTRGASSSAAAHSGRGGKTRRHTAPPRRGRA